MSNNVNANDDNAGDRINPPDLGGHAPGAANDPVLDRRENPNNRERNFRAQQTTPAGRTAINLVAQRLVANQDATPGWKNEEPYINVVPIIPERLRLVFELILFPIVYGNYRAIGTRTNNQPADQVQLDNIITTISVNAVLASYAVMYNKASALNTGYVINFGGTPDIDKFRFPALITFLINSLGPVQRDRDPYRCLFIPSMRKADVDTLRLLGGYSPLLEEMFTTGVLKTRNVLVTDVDVNSKDSSHWWTLYIERNHVIPNIPNDQVRQANEQNPARGSQGHTTVYSPIHFADRDSAVILGGLCLVETLYDLPGPLRTSRVGPFIGPNNNTRNSIPARLRDNIGINIHPVVVLYKFQTLQNHSTVPIVDRAVTNAQALAFGDIQNDPILAATADQDFTQARARSQNHHNTWEQYVNDLAAAANAVAMPGANPPPPQAPGVFLPGRPDDAAQAAGHLRVRECIMIYFDHRLYNEFPLSRIGSVITEASRINSPVQVGDEVFNRN